MDCLVAIDQLDDLVHNAKAVPMTDQVRIDRDRLQRALDDLLSTLPPDIERHPDVDAHTRLAQLVREAQPVPLTGELRLDKDVLYDLLDQLRRDLPPVLAGQRPLDPVAKPLLDALSAFERLVHAGRGFFSPAARVDPAALRAAVDEVHAATPADVRRADREGLLDELDRIVAEAPAARGDRVRVHPNRLDPALDGLRTLVDETLRR